MQPYFFPHLGHFALMRQVDAWVVFDTAQFRPRSYMVRNSILKAGGGTQRIGLSVDRGSINKSVGQTYLKSLRQSRESLLGSLSHYKSSAVNYASVIDLVEQCFNERDDITLSQFNYWSLKKTAEHLGISVKWLFSSDIVIDHSRIKGPGDWAPVLAEALGASAYINPVGGRHLFDVQQFDDLGISLEFLRFDESTYHPRGYTYIPNMSILDPLMWLSTDSIRETLDSAVIEAGNSK